MPPTGTALQYVAGDGHIPLPDPAKPVKIEQGRSLRKSIDWDAIRADHEARRAAEGTLDDDTPAAPALVRCRWCRTPQLADTLVDDLCPSCRDDAERRFTAPDTTRLGQDLGDLEAEDPQVAAASASYNAVVDRIIHPEDHAHLEVTELPTEGKQGQPTTGSSAPGATATSSQSGRAPARAAGSSTHQENDPEPTRDTRPTVGSGPGDQLDQLIDELAQIRATLTTELARVEIALDRVLHVIRPTTKKQKSHTNGAHRLKNRIQLLGTTTAAIKQWALDQGLIDTIHRGSPAEAIVDAYERAHQAVSA